MKQKQIIILSSFLFVLLMFTSLIIFFKTSKKTTLETEINTNEKVNKEVDDEIDKNETLTKEEKENLSNHEKETLVYGEIYGSKDSVLTLGDDKNKEYGRESSIVLYKELIKLSQKASYIDIINKVEALTDKYKFTEDYNWRICNIYLDANVMVNLKNVTEKGQKGYMVSNLKDPYMLLTGTLMIPEIERREVITETGSLSPIFQGEVNIGETKIFTEENKNDDINSKIILENEFSVKELYQINFSVEGNPLIAYIIRYSNGSISFKKITIDGEYEHPYKSISYWMNLDHIIYKK